MIPTPKSLGLPSKFVEWRPNQWQAIQDALNSVYRFIVQVQRGGRGKTLTYMTVAKLMVNARTIILTPNKGLQDDLLAGWHDQGLVDIRGKNSYQCESGKTCEDGSVSKCIYRGTSMCGHNYAMGEAKKAQLLVTNPACWMASNKYGQGFGPFDLMIIDEAHCIPGEVAKAMRISITGNDIALVKRNWPDKRTDMTEWKHWAAVTLAIVEVEEEKIKDLIDKPGRPSPALAQSYKRIRLFSRKLADIATSRADRWVVEESQYGYQFDVVEPSLFVERMLFRGIPKVLQTSGTIRPKTLELEGLGDKDYEFFEYPSEINPARSPFMLLETGLKINRNTPDHELRIMVRWIDKIIDGRLDRKGIIHTANKRLRDFIMTHSKHKMLMDTNWEKDRISEVITKFKNAESPRVLVSASVTTGFDFPYDACRYQIICKMLYDDLGSKVEQARMKLDPQNAAYNMMQSVAQAFSRGDRGDDDQQEVFMLDENFKEAMWRYADCAPSWLPAYVQLQAGVPEAPELEAMQCL